MGVKLARTLRELSNNDSRSRTTHTSRLDARSPTRDSAQSSSIELHNRPPRQRSGSCVADMCGRLRIRNRRRDGFQLPRRGGIAEIRSISSTRRVLDIGFFLHTQLPCCQRRGKTRCPEVRLLSDPLHISGANCGTASPP